MLPHLFPGVVSLCFNDHVHNKAVVAPGGHGQGSLPLLRVKNESVRQCGLVFRSSRFRMGELHSNPDPTAPLNLATWASP